MMETIKTIQYMTKDTTPVLATAHLRKDFYSLFANDAKELMEESGCNYFCHVIIKNYRQKQDYIISSYNIDEEWQELYWDKYREDDPVERASHGNTLKKRSGLAYWEESDLKSECTEARHSMCDTQTGFMTSFKHESGLIENVSFGWKKYDFRLLDQKKMEKLIKLILPIRNYHIQNSLIDLP